MLLLTQWFQQEHVCDVVLTSAAAGACSDVYKHNWTARGRKSRAVREGGTRREVVAK